MKDITKEMFQNLTKSKQNRLYEKVNFAMVALEEYCNNHPQFVTKQDREQLEELRQIRRDYEEWSCVWKDSQKNW